MFVATVLLLCKKIDVFSASTLSYNYILLPLDAVCVIVLTALLVSISQLEGGSQDFGFRWLYLYTVCGCMAQCLLLHLWTIDTDDGGMHLMSALMKPGFLMIPLFTVFGAAAGANGISLAKQAALGFRIDKVLLLTCAPACLQTLFVILRLSWWLEDEPEDGRPIIRNWHGVFSLSYIVLSVYIICAGAKLLRDNTRLPFREWMRFRRVLFTIENILFPLVPDDRSVPSSDSEPLSVNVSRSSSGHSLLPAIMSPLTPPGIGYLTSCPRTTHLATVVATCIFMLMTIVLLAQELQTQAGIWLWICLSMMFTEVSSGYLCSETQRRLFALPRPEPSVAAAERDVELGRPLEPSDSQRALLDQQPAMEAADMDLPPPTGPTDERSPMLPSEA
jgi:hypothetical protein